MSRDASTVEDFATGSFQFRLAWGELEKLQEETNVGPYVVLDRLVSGRWHVGDISAVIRLGLIGGGEKPADAIRLVRQYVQERPPLESLWLAQKVLAVAVAGASEEIVGKKPEAANQTDPNLSPKDGSDLPQPTEPGQS